MPFRLLVYMLRVWERWLKDHPGAKPLPLVFPLVLYHGDAAWTAPLDLAELIQLPKDARDDLGRALPHLKHDLLDLSEPPEEALTDGALVALTLLLLKHHRSGDLVEHLARWARTFKRAMQEGGLRAVERVARHILIVNTPSDTLPRLRKLTGEVLGDTAEDVVMTAGERLIEQGRIEGLRRGEATGRRAEAAHLLLRMLSVKFGDVPQAVRARIDAAELETLEAWAERIFAAETPEDVVR